MIEVKFLIKIPDSVTNMKENLARGVVKTMNEEIPKLKEEIISRTLSGQDVNGGSFAAYRPSTLNRRARQGLQTSPVNLRRSGEMLDLQTNIKVTSEGIQGEISTPTPASYAQYHQTGTRKMAKRKFLGFSKQQIINFKRVLVQNILRNFNK